MRTLPAAQCAEAGDKSRQQRGGTERARREQRQQEDHEALQLAPEELLVEVLEGHLARRVWLLVAELQAAQAVREAGVAPAVEEGNLQGGRED